MNCSAARMRSSMDVRGRVVSEFSRRAAGRTRNRYRSDIHSYVLAGTGRSTIRFGPSGVGKWSVRSYA